MMARTLAYWALIVLIPLTLAGCPIPLVPSDEDDSRLNVGDNVPDFIITGKTTRADVLLALGEPDGESEHGEWFAYTRRTSTGGVLFFMATLGGAGGASTEGMAYRRLMIQFDDAGVVKSARHELVTCSEKELLIGRGCQKLSPLGFHPARLRQPSTIFRQTLSANAEPANKTTAKSSRRPPGTKVRAASTA